MVEGVHSGFRKGLEIVGVGYRAEFKEGSLQLNLGFSHPYVFKLPPGIQANVERQVFISIEGIDKHLVGETAARIRRIRPPDSYKGKGVRYQGEKLKLKENKKSAKK
jgi:large subunit ribosomal protein L6